MNKISVLIFTCFLSGCALLRKEEPLPLYTLKSTAFEPAPLLSLPLAIDLPLSEASLNTQRIALTPSPYQRDYMAEGEWPDKLPKVLQEALLESLSQRWGGAYVHRMSAGLQMKYALQSEIQDFSVYYLERKPPEVHLRIMLKLIHVRSRQVLTAHTFSQIIQVPAPTMNGIVAAFNKGLHDLLVDAIPWMEGEFLKESRPPALKR